MTVGRMDSRKGGAGVGVGHGGTGAKQGSVGPTSPRMVWGRKGGERGGKHSTSWGEHSTSKDEEAVVGSKLGHIPTSYST